MFLRLEVVSGVTQTTSGDRLHRLDHTFSLHNTPDRRRVRMANPVQLMANNRYIMLLVRRVLLAAMLAQAHINHRLHTVHH
jgi:hypothetical protein